MSDIRAKIADALREELSWTALESVNPVALADLILSLPGVTTIALPAVLAKINLAQQNCQEDAADNDREPDERAFYAGQAEGYRLAAQWLAAAEAANNA